MIILWKKIKHMLSYIIRSIFLLSLIIGYFLSVDYWINEINIDFGTGMLLAITIACISLYQINNEQEERKHNSEIEQKEKDRQKHDFIKFIYENNYDSLKIIDKICLSKNRIFGAEIYLKTNEVLYQEFDNISWINTQEKLIKLDNYISQIIENYDETQKMLFTAGSIYEERIDNYLKK